MKDKQQELERQLSIINGLKPRFYSDGNQWCFSYGTWPNDCIVGFGDTPKQAMESFTFAFEHSIIKPDIKSVKS
jgi:hypothetical protein